MVKKLISILLTTSLVVSGAVTKVYASSVDDLYKSAYDSTMKARQNKNQSAISEARQAIGKLPKDMNVAIGEFSKLVDEPQQRLFEDFMSVIFESNGSKKSFDKVGQKDLNKGRQLLNDFSTYEGNKPYINSWSSALDIYQQYLIDRVVDAVNKAKGNITQQNIDNARTLVNELLTVQGNNGVYDYAKGLESQLNNLKPLSDNDLDPNPAPIAYKEHTYFFINKDDVDYPNDPSYRLKYDELNGWRIVRVGFDTVQPVFEQDTNNYTESMFQYNYQVFGPYIATYIKGYTFKDKTNHKDYAELVRLADGFVLERIDSNGKIETFTPPALTIKQLKDFKAKTYDQLLSQYKGR